MYCKSPLKRSTVPLSRLRTQGLSPISTSCACRNSDNFTRVDSNQSRNGTQSAFTSESSSPEPAFLRRFVSSLRGLETSIGTSQQALHNTLRSSMPLLKPSTIGGPGSSSSDQSSRQEKKSTLNLIQSIQLKLALSSLESDSSRPFPGLHQTLEKFQEKLLQDEQQLTELADWDGDGGQDGLLRSFHSVRPTECFLTLLAAQLMNPRLSRRENDPMLRHLFMLLNIIQMIRSGSRTRLDAEALYPESGHSTNSSASMERHRWSILKGNFYYYNVTYSLMRLNMKNVTQLMSGALQDITGIQFWIEKEATTRLAPQAERPHLLVMSSAVRHQLATGQLMSIWQSVLAAREASLLSNGFQSVAYLLGKDSPAEYAVAQQLGVILAQILSLLDDFCYLKHECQVAGLDSPERWPAVRHFNFLLRLPVLLYLKEAAINSRLQLPATETECHNLAINVLTNIERSDALLKTAALIEYNVNTVQALVRAHYEETPVREAFLAMLATCAVTN